MTDHQHTNVPEPINQSVKEIRAADKLIEEVIKTETEAVNQADKIGRDLKTTRNPEWKLETSNRIEGTVSEEPISVWVEISFELDIKTLIRQADKMGNPGRQVKKAVTVLESQPYGEELSQAIETAYQPQALGRTTEITTKQAIGKSTGNETEGLIQLTVNNGLVRCDWTQILNRWLRPEGELNRQLFMEKCWVNWEFLLGTENFDKTFAWEDRHDNLNLSIMIDTHWVRI